MNFKRFAQLFVIFLVAAAVLVLIYQTNFAGNKIVSFVLATIVAYAVLVLPLVLLTVAKSKKQ